MFAGVTTFGLGIAILSALVFALLHWLGVPAGNFLDWVIGVATFEWLLIITTVPWNIHFEAKEVLSEADRSKEKGVEVRLRDLGFARTVAQRFFWLALGLHGLSAVALYALAFLGISSVGYVGSVAALLLTFLRPVLRGAQYVYTRLRAVKQQIRYPREDVQELRSRVLSLESQTAQLAGQVKAQAERLEEAQTEGARLAALLREQQAENLQTHERLSREARSAIAQLSTDGQVLDHVREIIRFFKAA
jgi:outer membrane murein-binding lipoprotein Lpp